MRASSSTPPHCVRVRAAREVVDRVLASGESVYGLNTGLGSLSRHHIPLEEIGAFSFATVADQVSSYGRPLATDVVRAMMVSRVNGMLKAGVGVRRELIELLVALLNADVHPVVRMVGSVGPGRPVGDGRHRQGADRPRLGGVRAARRCTGDEALRRAGIEPITLGPKEALGLISANAVTIGRGIAGAGRRGRPDREHADRRRAELRGVRGQPLGDPSGG